MVDCGSSANEAIDYLNKKKIKSIIVDHHEINKPFPKANFIINPNIGNIQESINMITKKENKISNNLFKARL